MLDRFEELLSSSLSIISPSLSSSLPSLLATERSHQAWKEYLFLSTERSNQASKEATCPSFEKPAAKNLADNIKIFEDFRKTVGRALFPAWMSVIFLNNIIFKIINLTLLL
jgi:hypothetical protein